LTTRARSTPRFVLSALLLFTVLWAAVTYPQVLRMQDGVNDIGDPLLNTWALAWVAHQLPFAPAHLFDGNIFYPERRTLAYSETLLAPALVGAPLLWLGAGPILVYNLLLMAAFVLSGVAMALLVRDLTASDLAGLVAGAIFAFLPWRFDHYLHFQLLQTQWIPLALWALHRLLRDGRMRYGVVLGAAVGAQALSSMYLALFLGVFLAVVGGVLLVASREKWVRHYRGLAVAVLVAAVMATPAVIAHLGAHEQVGERSREEVRSYSAQWKDFATSTGQLARRVWMPEVDRHEHRLYPGIVAVLLALVGLWPPWSATRVAYALGLLLAIDMARGLNGWTYGWFYDHVFAFRALRVPARMALMAGVAIAVLAGFGLARMLARMGSERGRIAVAAIALALVLADSWVAPLRLATVPTAPSAIYADLLADKGDPPRTTIIRRQSDPPPAVVFEFPINREDTRFMYYSTFHWQSLVNGYSGFYSPRYGRLDQQLRRFPAHDALQELARLQVRYFVIHGEMMPPERYRELTAALDALAPQVRLVSRRPWSGAEISLYRFSFFAKE
jgi:hypothetical protein